MQPHRWIKKLLSNAPKIKGVEIKHQICSTGGVDHSNLPVGQVWVSVLVMFPASWPAARNSAFIHAAMHHLPLSGSSAVIDGSLWFLFKLRWLRGWSSFVPGVSAFRYTWRKERFWAAAHAVLLWRQKGGEKKKPLTAKFGFSHGLLLLLCRFQSRRAKMRHDHEELLEANLLDGAHLILTLVPGTQRAERSVQAISPKQQNLWMQSNLEWKATQKNLLLTCVYVNPSHMYAWLACREQGTILGIVLFQFSFPKDDRL